jgi:hypothetical protein
MPVEYECKECGKKVILENGEEAPECCGEIMPVCTRAGVAEHARPFEEEDEPCDDGRGGIRK